MNSQPIDEQGLTRDQRPCPNCRGALSKALLFQRHAFEPTDADMGIKKAPRRLAGTGEDAEIINDRVEARARGKKRGKFGKKKAKGFAGMSEDLDKTEFDKIKSEDESEDESEDDLRDFIVDDESEENISTQKLEPKRKIRRNVVLDSDDEDESNPLLDFSFTKKAKATEEKLLASNLKFLPSTKMKVMMDYIHSCQDQFPDEKVPNLLTARDLLTGRDRLSSFPNGPPCSISYLIIALSKELSTCSKR